MNLDDLRSAKADLELQISQAVASSVEAFRDRTGLTPSSIDIPMIEITSFGSRQEYAVGPARVEIKI